MENEKKNSEYSKGFSIYVHILEVLMEEARKKEPQPLTVSEIETRMKKRLEIKNEEQMPSHNRIDKALQELYKNKSILPADLRCYMVQRKGNEIISMIDYDAHLDEYETERKRNNQGRCYLLKYAIPASQWHILTDLLEVYPYIGETQTKEFLKSLDRLFPGCYTKARRYAHKHETGILFRTIQIIDAAIAEKHTLTITYGEYKLEPKNGGWEPALIEKTGTSWPVKINPYILMWANGYYYLIGKEVGGKDRFMNLRADRILHVDVDESTQFTIPRQFDAVQYRDKSPIMHPGESVGVRMRIREYNINTILDVFGKQVTFLKPENGFVEVSLTAAPMGVKMFAKEYSNSVEVLSPQFLREEIRDELFNAYNMYR